MDSRPSQIRRLIDPSPSIDDAFSKNVVSKRSSPSKTTFGENKRCVMSAIENRAKEIGIAIYDGHRHTLSLSQFIETSRSYTTTLMLLRRWSPRNLIVVDERTKSRAGGLNTTTENVFQQVHLPRSAFDDSKAEITIDRLANEENALSQLGANKRRYYLAIGAVGALLTFLEETENIAIASHSLTIELIGTEMSILEGFRFLSML